MTLDKPLSDQELLRIATARAAGSVMKMADAFRELAFEPTVQPTHRVAPKLGRMNKLETAWSQELELAKAAGKVRAWIYGGVSFRLADRTWYRPDFLVACSDGRLDIVEVKGHWEDDARVKFKVAAELYPMFRFRAVRRRRKREGGGWAVETLND